MTNPTACPLCGCEIKIHHDAPGAVPSDIAGFYVSHPFWIDYPVVTTCKMYGVMNSIPTQTTREQCIATWNALAPIVASAGNEGAATIRAIEDLAIAHASLDDRSTPWASMDSMTTPQDMLRVVSALEAAGAEVEFQPVRVPGGNMPPVADSLEAYSARLRDPSTACGTDVAAAIARVLTNGRKHVDAMHIVITD